jgi:Holliday junction resolvase RusA-like endonuclease
VSVEQAPNDTDRALAFASVVGRVTNTGEDRLVMITIPGNPPTKVRPRVGPGGRVYHDPAAKAVERRTGRFIRDAIGGEKFTGNVGVGAIFFRADRRHQDVDNMLKHVCDAANKVAWQDDSQVTAMLAMAEYDRDNPRTVLVLTPHQSSLQRGSDDVVACKGCGNSIERRLGRLYCTTCTPQRKKASHA